MRLRSSETKDAVTSAEWLQDISPNGKVWQEQNKREKKHLLVEGESIYTTVAFIGRSTSRKARQSGNFCICRLTSGERRRENTQHESLRKLVLIYNKKKVLPAKCCQCLFMVVFLCSPYAAPMMFLVFCKFLVSSVPLSVSADVFVLYAWMDYKTHYYTGARRPDRKGHNYNNTIHL